MKPKGVNLFKVGQNTYNSELVMITLYQCSEYIQTEGIQVSVDEVTLTNLFIPDDFMRK